jgi:hypothetical protein
LVVSVNLRAGQPKEELMSLMPDFQPRRHIGRIMLASVGLGALALGGLSMLGGGGSAATAQTPPSGCSEEYRLCITKETLQPTNIDFPFAITYEQEPDSESVSDLDQETYYLGSGESLGLYPYGVTTIQELSVPGWVLVDVDCEGSDAYNVTYHERGITVSYFTGAESSFLNCVWTNRQVQQEQRPNLNLGGLFADKPNIPPQGPAPGAPSAVAGAPVISPPNTGDGGLK